MNVTPYTAITFAPVQGFIEKSRKLRDLYGSSYLLSLLAQSLCIAAEQAGHTVISPALPNVTQGMPNQIIIRGKFPEDEAEQCFFNTWACVTKTCREWIECEVRGDWSYKFWKRDWDAWAKYTWEFFHVIGKPGESITHVRNRLNEKKRSRAWTGINWQGESSTLSGTDAVAWAELGKITQPHEQMLPWEKDARDGKSQVERFYEALSQKLGETFIESIEELQRRPPSVKAQLSIEFGEAFIDPAEELSIPELVKRLITHVSVVEKLIEQMGELDYLKTLKEQIERDLDPQSFSDLNRLQHKKRRKKEESIKQYWTGWFQGDGDGASDYLKWLGEQGKQAEEEGTIRFSTQMRQWGQEFKDNAASYLPNRQSRLIYAGGDDFLGVLYNSDSQLPPRTCLQWFTTFNSRIWEGIDPTQSSEKITATVGFVWVSPKVPQRDVLQHCREAEQSAKRNGKDRIAFRIVFSGGNALEWICPWWILEEGLFESYRDRNGVQGISNNANWTHLYNDIAVLESRHAFGADNGEQVEVAQSIFQAYFGEDNSLLDESNWWNIKNEVGKFKIERAGILGEQKSFQKKGVLDERQITKTLNDWVINLAKVGFHLCSDT